MTRLTARYRLRALVIGAIALFASVALRAAPGRSDSSDDQAKRTAAAYLKRLGPGYKARFDQRRRILYISALDKRHLTETIESLAVFSDAFRRTLHVKMPDHVIIVVLPVADDYRSLSPAANVTGYYQPSDRTLIAIDRGRVLFHEFTHALHHADAAVNGQDHPVWIREGLACLFETSRITPAGLEPQVDARVLTLQRAIRLRQTVSLERLISLKRPAFMRDAELCYAEARYVMLYLFQKGLLDKWYARYKRTFKEDRTGRKAFEKVLGRGLFQVRQDWLSWVKDLKIPWGRRRAGQGRLGLQMKNTSNGVKVVGLVEHGPAARAGQILVGDFILEFNGYKIRNSAEAAGAIRVSGAMRTVAVKLRRNGRILTVYQPLGSPGETRILRGKLTPKADR